MLVCFGESQGYTWPEISIVEMLHGRCDAKEAGGGEHGGRPTPREERARFGPAEFAVGRDLAGLFVWQIELPARLVCGQVLLPPRGVELVILRVRRVAGAVQSLRSRKGLDRAQLPVSVGGVDGPAVQVTSTPAHSLVHGEVNQCRGANGKDHDDKANSSETGL